MRTIIILIFAALLITGCESTHDDSEYPESNPETLASMEPPIAAKRPVTLEMHGDSRVDDYFWIRERENPEVIEYLEAENAHTDAQTAHTNDLQEALFDEIVGRIKQDDSSVPYRDGAYWYYTRFEEGSDYPIFARKYQTLDAREEIMLNANELAEGHEFFSLGGFEVSSNDQILAYSTDTVGRRFYTVRFKNLETGDMLDDVIPDITGNVAWANDNKTVFYTKQDRETLLWNQIYRHELGTPVSQDVLIYEEPDDTFSCFVFKTKSKDFLLIGSNQTLSSEYRFLDANNPTGAFEVIHPREDDHEYSVDHYGNYFYVRTNWQASNFRLMRVPIVLPTKDHWQDVIPHRTDVFLQGYELFKDHLVVLERKNGLRELRIRPWDGSEEHYLEFDEPAYYAGLSTNLDFDTNVLRYSYQSMTTPNSTYDYNMVTREKTLLKEQEVLGGFDKSNYTTERRFATARDGVQVPVSIVYRNGTPLDGTSPLMLSAYGSYGSSREATFSSPRLSLLDRGVVFAIAHIRGGQEMGRHWYEDGKLFKKKNTFTDFIDVAEDLVEEGYADPERLFAEGGSAGGLLMGAVANMRPDLWKGIFAYVPWVDVVTTMLDDSIPLTTSEYDEWGDPNQKDYYDYMLSYSPYDNVEAKDYPNMLVTTGLHDSQVQYWEPTKWVAKLRDMKTDNNRLLLKTNMEAGHGGATGRLKQHRETAFEYAFLLDLAGIHNIEPDTD